MYIYASQYLNHEEEVNILSNLPHFNLLREVGNLSICNIFTYFVQQTHWLQLTQKYLKSVIFYLLIYTWKTCTRQ
jgi:hypothetical protein